MSLAALVLALEVSAADRLEEFSSYVHEAFSSIGAPVPEVIVSDYETSLETPIKIYRVPVAPGTVIHVHESVLGWGSTALRVGAEHEACHEALGHLDTSGGEVEEELAANRCVMEKVGVGAFRMALRDLKGLDHLSDEELDARLRSGYEVYELPGPSGYPEWITELTPESYDAFVSEGPVAVLNCHDDCTDLIKEFGPYHFSCPGNKVGLVRQDATPIRRTDFLEDPPVLLFGEHPDGQGNSWYGLNVRSLTPTKFGLIHCGIRIEPEEKDPYASLQNALEAMERLQELARQRKD